jgi:hypothetical protein
MLRMYCGAPPGGGTILQVTMSRAPHSHLLRSAAHVDSFPSTMAYRQNSRERASSIRDTRWGSAPPGRTEIAGNVERSAADVILETENQVSMLFRVRNRTAAASKRRRVLRRCGSRPPPQTRFAKSAGSMRSPRARRDGVEPRMIGVRVTSFELSDVARALRPLLDASWNAQVSPCDFFAESRDWIEHHRAHAQRPHRCQRAARQIPRRAGRLPLRSLFARIVRG